MILKKKKNVVSYLRKGRQMIDKKEKRHKEELETGQWLWHS